MVYGDLNSCQEMKREGVRAYTCGRPIKTGHRCDECQAEHDGAPAVIALLRQRIFDLEQRVKELSRVEAKLSQVALEALRVVHCTTHGGDPHVFEPCGECSLGGVGNLRDALRKALGSGYTGLVWGLDMNVDREKWLAALAAANEAEG